MKRVLLFLSLLLILSMACISVCYANEETETEQSKERMLIEGNSNDEYQWLLDGLKSEAVIEEGKDYPDYYAGAYVNAEGKLVVMLTEGSNEETVDIIREYTNNPDIKVQYAKTPYNELIKAQKYINETYSDYIGKGNLSSYEKMILGSITSHGIDQEKNCLYVEMQGLNTFKEKGFYCLFPDVNMVVFKRGSFATYTIAWNPGRAIYKVMWTRSSTGYPSIYTDTNQVNHYGFITAGHAYSVNSSCYRSAQFGTVLGNCLKSQNTGSVDASFIEITDSNYSVSNATFYDGITLSSYTCVPAQGSTVYKEGSTTGRTSGTVIDNSATYYTAPLTVGRSDMVKTNALNLPGDSGGVMYQYSTSDLEYYVVGSMSATTFIDPDGPEIASNFDCSYACKADNALAALNCDLP